MDCGGKEPESLPQRGIPRHAPALSPQPPIRLERAAPRMYRATRRSPNDQRQGDDGHIPPCVAILTLWPPLLLALP